MTDVGVNPSGSLIAVGRQDGSVQVLTTDGQVRSTFSLGSRRVVSVGWTKDGTLLAASLTGHVQIREDSGRRLLRELDHRSRIGAAAISTDGTLAATGGQDGNVRLWRLPGGTPLRVLPHDGSVTSLAIDPAAHTIASASGSTAYLWPVAGGEARPLRDPDSEGNVTGVAFGRRGRMLATSSESDALLWDTRTGTRVKRLSGHMNRIEGVAFSSDGRWLATASRKAGVWQVGDSDLPRSFLFFVEPPKRTDGKTLTSVAFSSRNWTIVTGGQDGTVRTYKCVVCGTLKQLVPYANSRLAKLKAERDR